MRASVWIAGVVIALFALLGSVFVVGEGKTALVVNLGRVVRADLEPGLHFKWPMVETARIFDRRLQVLASEPERILTLERKDVSVDYFAVGRISDARAFFRATGGDEDVAVQRLAPIIRESLKNEINSRTLKDLVSGDRSKIIGPQLESINVGAATESEMKEKKARVEDALHATRAAVEEGIVPGGGVALLRAQRALKNLKLSEMDEQVGVEIIKRSLEEPIRMIVQNAGGEPSLVVEKVRGSKEDSFGYNALTEVYENLVQAGVIDPTKVTRTALQNAASIASLLLTTEALIVEKKEDKPAPQGAPGGGMGGMY